MSVSLEHALGGNVSGNEMAAAFKLLRAHVAVMKSELATAIRQRDDESGVAELLKEDAHAFDAIANVLDAHYGIKDERTEKEKVQMLIARITELEAAQTLRPMADVPIGGTLILARHTALGWLSVARVCDDLEFRGRQGLAWSGEYFHGWIPMPVLPDQNDPNKAISLDVEL